MISAWSCVICIRDHISHYYISELKVFVRLNIVTSHVTAGVWQSLYTILLIIRDFTVPSFSHFILHFRIGIKNSLFLEKPSKTTLFWRGESCCFVMFYWFPQWALVCVESNHFCCWRDVICDVTVFLTCFLVWLVLLGSFLVLRGAVPRSLCVLLLASF